MPDIDDIWDDEEDRQQITEAERKERINALRQKIIDAEKALSGDTIQIPLAEYEKLKADAERLELMFVEECNIERLTLGNGTKYRINWPMLEEAQPEWFKSPREAIDAYRAAIKQEGSA